MRKFRKGFSMIMAIFVIVLLSLVASYIFHTSASITKEGTVQYQNAQAKIYARSFTEYAVLAVMGNSDRNSTNTCIKEINSDIGSNPAQGQGYRIHVDITYIGNQKYIQNCSNKAFTLSNNDTDTLSIIVDVYVKYKDLQNASLYNANTAKVPWQVYHRRSIQKI